MGRFVAGDAPELDRALADALAAIGAEIGAMRVPSLAGVVLGGGYGRGEGGARGEFKVQSPKFEVESSKADGACRLSNDLDFFAITKEGATDADAAAVAKALEPLSRRWSEKLGIDVDFTGRTPWRLRHDQERLMVQELVHGYVDVAGATGESLFAGIARREPSDLPWMEAARLLMNRGMGLLLAAEKLRSVADGRHPSSDCRLSDVHSFVNRNINKCILGAGDARLIANRRYRWRAPERAEALRDQMYRNAVAWKFRPEESAVCDWSAARDVWRAAYEEVMEIGAREGALGRSLRQAARWVVRRRTLGAPASFGQNCTVRVLRGVARCIESRSAIPPSLRRDWEIFN